MFQNAIYFERVAIDLLTNLLTTNKGNQHILICVDALTRFVELISIATKTAKDGEIAFHDHFILSYTTHFKYGNTPIY